MELAIDIIMLLYDSILHGSFHVFCFCLIVFYRLINHSSVYANFLSNHVPDQVKRMIDYFLLLFFIHF